MTEPSGEQSPLRPLGLLLGPVLLLATIVLPPPGELTVEAWRVAGLGALMATWWVTEAIPIPAAALLPIPLLPVLGVTSVEAAAAPFANPVIFLFMGGFMLAQTMQRWNLHRRIAFGIIAWTGTSPRRLVAGFMAASAFLSMWVSNTAVAVMMLPIGISVIQVVTGESDASRAADADPAFPVALLLGIAYGASIGGTATLIGTPPNAFLAGFMSEEFGVQVGFGEWMLVGVPLTVVLLPLTWVLLTRVAFRVDPRGAQLEPGALQGFREALGTIAAPEARTAWVFGATALAWIFRPVLERWVPGLSDAGIAMAASLLLFILPAGGGREGSLLDWDWARRIPWGILILFGGGLSLAAAISSSGLAEWIGGALQGVGQLPVIGIMFIVCALLVFLTELTSNTASAAAFVPILAGLAVTIGRDPLLLTVPAALGASCAFMLPVATPPNAIVFGTGYMRMAHMVKAGFLLNLVVIGVIPPLALLLLRTFFGVAG